MTVHFPLTIIFGARHGGETHWFPFKVFGFLHTIWIQTLFLRYFPAGHLIFLHFLNNKSSSLLQIILTHLLSTFFSSVLHLTSFGVHFPFLKTNFLFPWQGLLSAHLPPITIQPVGHFSHSLVFGFLTSPSLQLIIFATQVLPSLIKPFGHGTTIIIVLTHVFLTISYL